MVVRANAKKTQEEFEKNKQSHIKNIELKDPADYANNQ